MVGVNFYIHRTGTVAIFATLFVAILVNGVQGCTYDFALSSDFNLECNDVKDSWSVIEDAKDSPNKKVLALEPEQNGCLKTREAVLLNISLPVTLKFYRDVPKDQAGKVILRLIPKEGDCTDDECSWNIANDPQYKQGEWITADYKFPVKATRDYYVQLEVEKGKGKFLLERITVNASPGDSKCPMVDENTINLPKQLTGTGGNSSKNSAPGLMEMSKNLMLTSASVLTLNNLLN